MHATTSPNLNDLCFNSGFSLLESRDSNMKINNNDYLLRFGFKFGKGGAHTARTMMLAELKALMVNVNPNRAARTDYIKAIVDENCLSKRSGKTRALTSSHLVDLYSLDPSTALFRALSFFWKRDLDAQPLLALLCAYSRDTLLRMSAPFIEKFPEGATVTREALEQFIEGKETDRFSRATLKSTAQNINSTWTQSGHLLGRARKVRSRAIATPGAVAYALFVGFLSGARGESLLQTDYAKLLDCSTERSIEMAEDASRRGWIVFKRVGNVIEALFPNLLTPQEMEWIREQN